MPTEIIAFVATNSTILFFLCVVLPYVDFVLGPYHPSTFDASWIFEGPPLTHIFSIKKIANLNSM